MRLNAHTRRQKLSRCLLPAVGDVQGAQTPSGLATLAGAARDGSLGVSSIAE